MEDGMKFDLTIDPEETMTILGLFVKSYIKQSGSTSVVLGLSGGIDSALSCMICQRALGPEHVHCLFLPDESTPKKDREDIGIFVNTFNVDCETKDITPLVHTIMDENFIKEDKLCRANVKARLRMTLLYLYANKKKSIVCGTSNKSEILIGYFTKYGDGGVDIMPIGDVYKTQVFQIANHVGLPESMITKPPTAGLWKGQKDEDELHMTYEVLDKILYGLEWKYPLQNIAQEAQVSVEEVRRIQSLRKKSEHKRHFPLVAKISLRTPSLDWRSPIQEG
jgi:NAD+ synthase